MLLWQQPLRWPPLNSEHAEPVSWLELSISCVLATGLQVPVPHPECAGFFGTETLEPLLTTKNRACQSVSGLAGDHHASFWN